MRAFWEQRLLLAEDPAAICWPSVAHCLAQIAVEERKLESLARREGSDVAEAYLEADQERRRGRVSGEEQ